MNLVSTLAAGVAAAPNGWAEIYVRGSSTRATIYPDFEASTSDSSGADIDLDAYGSVEVYVNQLVDVVVKSSDGTIVRSFTEGHSAPVVEVISPAFTGNDYVTAAAAVNEPTTLQAVLDLWATNGGAPDWKVLIGGAATTLLNAFGTLSGLVFNVKSPAYGAVGDGVANDQTAIAAALAAAAAAGGGIVFFPKGTYLITTAIEWDHRVSILGVGGSLSVITVNSGANARILTWTSGTAATSPQSIVGMGFAASQASAGEQLYSTVAVNLCVERCLLGGSNNSIGDLVSFAGASKIRLLNSRFTVYGTAKTAMTWSAATMALVHGCHIDTGNSAYVGSFIKSSGWTTVSACLIDQTLNTAGVSPIGVEMLAAADVLTVRDTRFLAVGQAFAQCIKLFAGSKATTSGNEYGFSTWYNAPASQLSNGSQLQLTDNSTISSTSTTATLANYCDTYDYTATAAAASLALTMPTKYWVGQRFTLSIFNTSGNNWTPTFPGSGASTNTTIPLINSGSSAILNFVLSGIGWRLSNT